MKEYGITNNMMFKKKGMSVKPLFAKRSISTPINQISNEKREKMKPSLNSDRFINL